MAAREELAHLHPPLCAGTWAGEGWLDNIIEGSDCSFKCRAWASWISYPTLRNISFVRAKSNNFDEAKARAT